MFMLRRLPSFVPRDVDILPGVYVERMLRGWERVYYQGEGVGERGGGRLLMRGSVEDV